MSRLPFALLALLALLATLFVGGCREPETRPAPHAEEHGHEEEAHGDAGGNVELTPDAAKAARIESRVLARSLFRAEESVPGVVETMPVRRALVTPPVAGRVLKLLVGIGEAVRKGQPLAVIESVDLAERANAIAEAERGVAAAKAEGSRAYAELALARSRARAAASVLARQRELARAGAFSQPSLQAAERELSDARAGLEGAQKEATVHRAQLERAERLFRQELVSRIEVENARLDVEKDRIAQERAERAIAIARSSFERERAIARRGLANAREVQAAEADARAARLEAERAAVAQRAAQAAVVGARTAVANAQTAYGALRGEANLAGGGRLTIVAPLSGRVFHRGATVGQAVERTTDLFEIDDLREVLVVAQVPERAIGRLKRGAFASIVTDAYPDRRFGGTVDTIGGRMDPKTRTLPVSYRVPNGDAALRPEMFVEVLLGKGASRSVLAVPSGATFMSDGESYVYVEMSPGKYERRAVALGPASGGRTEILRGLKVGERVVAAGVFTLRSEAQKDELKGHEH